MEHRLKTLAKTLHDAADEAERCCEYQKEIDKLQTAVCKLKNENSILSRKTEDMADKEKELKAALAKEKDSSSTFKQRLEESLSKQKAQLERIEASKRESAAAMMARIGSLQKDLQEMTDKENNYKAELAEEKESSSKLKQCLEESLSKQNAMRDSIQKARNNDVSDTLRPTKVAEIYQELYDNEWSDAYEMLDKLGLQEDKAIETLLQVLKHVMEYCKKRSKQQNSSLHQNLMLTEKRVNGELSDPIPRHLEYCKKELSSVTIETLYETYISNADGAHESGVKDILKIKPFVKECIRACWLCVIQHEPMHVIFDANAYGTSFNSDVYRPYTKTGTQVDILVWPTLLLHENGPVLAKGIAQGTNKSLSSNISKQKVVARGTRSSVRRKNRPPPQRTHNRRNRDYVCDPNPFQNEVYISEQNFPSKDSVKLPKSIEVTSSAAQPCCGESTESLLEPADIYTQTFKEITQIRDRKSASPEEKYRDLESDIRRSLKDLSTI